MGRQRKYHHILALSHPIFYSPTMPKRIIRKQRSSATDPATKSDIALLAKRIDQQEHSHMVFHKEMTQFKDDMTQFKDETLSSMASLHNEQGKLRSEMETWKNDLEGKMESWKEEIKDEFRAQIHILSGQIRHDLLGVREDEIVILKDSATNHQKRLERLEQHAGFATAL